MRKKESAEGRNPLKRENVEHEEAGDPGVMYVA
jgi:hypothetical protein